jgi:hypothetical protein
MKGRLFIIYISIGGFMIRNTSNVVTIDWFANLQSVGTLPASNFSVVVEGMIAYVFNCLYIRYHISCSALVNATFQPA